jgi:Transglutaminase-like superfamily
MAGSYTWHRRTWRPSVGWRRRLYALRARAFGAAVGFGLTLALAAHGQLAGPVLHEYFDFDLDVAQQQSAAGVDRQASDLEQSQNLDGQAANTHLGDPGRASQRGQEYALDGDTSRPDSVGYADPFTPSVPPFKRQYAFDSVGADFELIVADRRLAALPIGGRALRTDDQFFADMQLALEPSTPVRIPSVGPGTRVLAAQTLPAAPFELLKDSAENWFIRGGGAAGDYRLILHLAIDRDAFGGAFASVSWSRLARLLPNLPRGLMTESEEVLSALELDRRVTPAAALLRLVEHFRNFAPADAKFTERGAALYRRIALSQQGVCRHRAFAFTITALALGIPTRFVHNEAHAWVEVNDGQLWHRIDLGGAAGHLEFTAPLEAQHLPPRDPYAWPANAESGQRLANEAFRRPAPSGSAGAGGAGASAGARAPGSGSPEASPSGGANQTAFPAPNPDASGATPIPGASAEESPSSLPPANVTIRSGAGAIRRGQRLTVEGRVTGTERCELLRVDVTLVSGGRSERVGTLVTGADGRFAGELVVPDFVPPGDYALRASTPGNLRCGAGTSH